MVRSSKGGLLALWLMLSMPFFLFSSISLAGESAVKIYPKQLILGQPVTLVLNGEQALQDFDKLNLSELKQQFAIYEIDRSSDQIRLRLYPLTAGLLTIPEIKASSIYIPLTPITVNPNPEVNIVWQSPKTSAYVGESLLWKATVVLKNAANQASFFEHLNPNWQVQYQEQAVAEQLNTGADSAGKTVVLVANYQFSGPDSNRTQTLQSPAVTVKNTSNRRWLFFDAPQPVNIKLLPQFLPMSITVGQVSLKVINDGFFKTSGDLNYWVWQLEGQGVDAFALQNLAHELIAQIDHNERLEWLSESRASESYFTEEGLQTALTVRLPYRAVQAGRLVLPELNLRYFDVSSGKIVSQNFKSTTQFALPIWLIWIGQWLMLMFVLVILYAALWQIKQVWLNWRLRKAMYRASTTEQLIEAMFAWQKSQPDQTPLQRLWRLKPLKVLKVGQQKDSFKTSTPASSLQQFQERYEQRYGVSRSLEALIVELNQRLYASSPSLKLEQGELRALVERWLKEHAKESLSLL